MAEDGNRWSKIVEADLDNWIDRGIAGTQPGDYPEFSQEKYVSHRSDLLAKAQEFCDGVYAAYDGFVTQDIARHEARINASHEYAAGSEEYKATQPLSIPTGIPNLCSQLEQPAK